MGWLLKIMIKRKYAGQTQGSKWYKVHTFTLSRKWTDCQIRRYFKVSSLVVRIHSLFSNTNPHFFGWHPLPALSSWVWVWLYLQLEDRAHDPGLANQTTISPGMGQRWARDRSQSRENLRFFVSAIKKAFILSCGWNLERYENGATKAISPWRQRAWIGDAGPYCVES